MKRLDFTAPLLCLVGIVVLALIIAATPGLSDMIVYAANAQHPYHGPESVETDYAKGALWALVLGLSILVWPIPQKHKYSLLYLWVIRTCFTLGVMLVYEINYGFDNDGYFIYKWEDYYGTFSISDGKTNIRYLAWLHQQLIPNSFHAAKVGFSMFGHIAVYLIYLGVSLHTRNDRLTVLHKLYLFPSVLLWSCLLGKDPINLFGVGLYVYGVSRWHHLSRGFFKSLVCIFLGILICVYVRPWFGVLLCVPLILLTAISLRQNAVVKAFAFMVLVGGGVISWQVLERHAGFESFNSMLTSREIMAAGFSNTGAGGEGGGGSRFSYIRIPNAIALVFALPIGILTALFRPFPWEAHNAFSGSFAVENVFLFYLFSLSLKRTKFREILDPFILWAIAIIALWAAMYGLVVYNFGALSRFKLQIQPIFIFLLLHLSRKKEKSISPRSSILPSVMIRPST